MWSRLAEGLAEIVAPEEGYAQELDDTSDQDSIHVDSVAMRPQFGSVKGSVPSVAADKLREDEDEQEEYIRDLERALLQQKKQNNVLENRIKEMIESQQDNGDRAEQKQLKGHVRDQEEEDTLRHKDVTIEDKSQAAELVDAAALQSEEDSVARVKYHRLVQDLQQSQIEVSTLAAQCQAQAKELMVLRDKEEALQVANETLQQDEQEIRARAAEYEQAYVDLLAEIEQIKTANAEEKTALIENSKDRGSLIDSQRLYDLEAQLTTAEADKVLAQQDAERLQRDVDTLEDVLRQFQMDSKAHRARINALEAELEQTTRRLQSHQPLLGPNEGERNDSERLMEKLDKKTHECEQLREALESTATQYTSERDVVDKRLAAQLVVAYVDSEKKGEILHLMARIMDFTEDQKRRVGVGYPVEGNGGGGLFSSLLGLVAPGDESASVDPSTIEGKNFSELWSDFLLDETSNRK